MSFGGSFGSGGFGANNNNQQGSTFGGFGSSNNTPTSGFGTNANTGFGASNTNTGGGMFGSGGGSGFGASTGGGFGTNTNTGGGLFGQSKPAFGSTTTSSSGGGLFGSTTATAGGSGFGSGGGFGGNTANTGSGFGSSNTGGGLFGSTQNKPAFGATGAGGSLFGAGNTGGGFGSPGNTAGTGTGTGAFGAGASTTFGNNQAPNQGTGNVQFQAHTEKEGTGSAASNVHYQSITFQQPYQGYSFEELRLADYMQGRRFGNQNGQAGAFGQSSTFGGFGSNNTPNTGFGANTGNTGNTGGSNLFGQTNANQNTFGQTQQNTGTSFGGNTGGGLFGQNKPATGGLFGSTPATSAQQSGGAFGSSGGGFGSTTGGFGSNNASTGGGLFGNQNQQQNKPTFGFGATNTTTNTTGGFGTGTTGGFGQNQTTSGGGLFGGLNSTSGSFGNQQQPQSTNTFGFGSNQANQTQTQTQGGGLFGGSNGFGANNQQQKPGGLFGNTQQNAGGGLFGQTNQQPATGGLFNNANQNQQQQGGGLFGQQNQQKPGGLFGNTTNTNTNTGGGIFGNLNSQNQQQQGGGLFGQQNQQQKPSLFAPTQNTNSGGGLFGNLNNNNQQQQGGMFGSSQQNQQQPQLGNSMFGTSQQTPQQPSAVGLIANLTDNPYGNQQLFQGFFGSPGESIGPMITPLTGSQQRRKPTPLPAHRLNPLAASRMITPQKRTGFGFSYSTYGTPGSAMSNASPAGLGTSLLGSSLLGGGGLGRSLSKSYSTSNLRHSFAAEDSIIAPGVLSGVPRSYANTGSLKRLTIDRSLENRRPLFGPSISEATTPDSLRKKVSFDPSNATNGQSSQPTTLTSTNGALVRTEEPDDADTPRPITNGTQVNGSVAQPEMEQVRGRELAVVPEDGASAPAAGHKTVNALKGKAPGTQADQTPGRYWSKPPLSELRKMSPDQLKHVNLTVGRVNVGKIEFGDVDISSYEPDKLYGFLVEFDIRRATVYGDNCTYKKPPQGSGLNVPSTIHLENSWPRSQAGKLPVHEKKGHRFEKHISRLSRVENTEFIDYNTDTGTWIFRVQHYTTYGAPEDEDSSILSEAPDTPAHKPSSAPRSVENVDSPQADITMVSTEDSALDDTFDFKKGARQSMPGTIHGEMVYEDEEDEETDDQDEAEDEQSFLDERSVGSLVEDGDYDMQEDAVSEEGEFDPAEGSEMAGSFPVPGHTTELVPANENALQRSVQPKSILKNSQAQPLTNGTPSKSFNMTGDWTEQLQNTVSPKKRDRQVLRETQASILRDNVQHHNFVPKSTNAKAFSTSVDLMNSLFGKGNGQNVIGTKQGSGGKGFEWPYPKRPKTGQSLSSAHPTDVAFHQSNKPSWGPDGTLVYAIRGNAPTMRDGIMVNQKGSLVSEHKDIRFAKFAVPADIQPQTLEKQKTISSTDRDGDGIPYSFANDSFHFSDFADLVDISTQAGVHEHQVWQLASILFDDLSNELPDSIPKDQYEIFEWRLRKDKLSEFWQKLVRPDADRDASHTKVVEEKALIHLSGNNLMAACESLVKGKDFRLAAMAAQIGGDEILQRDMADQIVQWRDMNVLSEITEPVRAIYELLAGNTSVCSGKTAGIENVASTFTISSRFGFDWRRAFGLRLWCSTGLEDSLDIAVRQFAIDLDEVKDEVKPTPWWIEQNVDMGWKPKPTDADGLEDLLWGLLKLFAAHQGSLSVDVDKIFTPENVSGNPLNARLSFQLMQLLRARGINLSTSFSDKENMSFDSSVYIDMDAPLETASDVLADTYAASLISSIQSNPDHFTSALGVLLHLSDPIARKQAVQSVLDHHAHLISTDPADIGFSKLTRDMLIPPAWLHTAKAQYARTVLHDRVQETHHLLAAHAFDAAHDVLTRAVAPRAIIDRDYDALRELLGPFTDSSNGRAPEQRIRDWNVGGRVYFDFIHMLDLERVSSRKGPEVVKERKEGLTRLVKALEQLGGLQKGMEIEEKVALREMSRKVAEWVVRGDEKGVEREKVLRLPLTESAYLKASGELAMAYYGKVMQGVR